MEIFIEPNPPRRRLLVVGDQPVAETLIALGRALGYQVLAVGDRAPSEGVDSIPNIEGLSESVHPLTFVVVASHGTHDEIAVESALAAGAPYVGLVASRQRAESVRGYLRGRGVDTDSISALHSPAGLDIGARTPEEIALSIFAEIVQIASSLEPLEWPTGTSAEAPPQTALDPVCGMSVEIEGAQHIFELEGELYYFCCASCRESFKADRQPV